jgi:N-methylhydantoinase A/oxoprolinase/acetone carboxylase beta subunit
MTWTVTIDNGSTFTDGCLLADGKVWTVKVLTTPYDLMRCFVDVFRNLAHAVGLPNEAEMLRRVEEVRYSTTSGTNALLVRKGVRVGLIAGSDGAADAYGLRHDAPELTEALLGDRISGIQLGEAAGSQVDDIILRSIRELLARGAQWLVVSLPEPWGEEGEREFKRRYIKLFPGHLLGSVPVLFSRELCADPDDARRTATAILNGFLHRDMARFLYHAEAWVREHHVVQPLRIMRNDGGCGRVAKTTAVKTLDSGPMGGLSGAGALSRLCNESKMITVDVGGTSADIGVVENQRPVVDLFGSVHSLPLSFSFPALRTAALGGGSLFRVRNGSIQIGPDSAGALPGPVCFGRGGELPTLTDASLVAGYLAPDRFAGGSIELRPDLADAAIADQIAAPLGLKGAQAGAWEMIQAFADQLAFEIRSALDQRSWTPEQTVLVSYGGSGPLLACMVADRVGLRQLIIPPASASFSALGVGFARLGHQYRALLARPVDERTWRDSAETARERAERDMFGEGVPASGCVGSKRLRAEADGIEYDLQDAAGVPAALAQGNGRVVFDYQSTFGASGLTQFPTPETGQGGAAGAQVERPVLLGNKPTTIQIVDAAGFKPGMTGHGPCVVESAYWSAVLPAGWKWQDTEFGVRLSR